MAQWEKLSPPQKLEILHYETKEIFRRLEGVEATLQAVASESLERAKTAHEIRLLLGRLLELLTQRGL